MNDDDIDLARAAEARLGSLVLAPSLKQVIGAGGAIETVEPRVMQVLLVLAAAQGAVVGRAELRARCWPGRTVGDDAIERAIGRIRRLLLTLDAPDVSLETIPKVGYRLSAAPPSPADIGSDDLVGDTSSPALPSRRAAMALAGLGVAGLVVGAGALLRGRGAAPAGSAPPTLAVLPFDGSTGDAAAASLAVALAARLRDDAARIAGLAVIAGDIGAGRSGATLLLSGRVDRVGASATLADAASGAQLWAGAVRRPTDTQADAAMVAPALSALVIEQLSTRVPALGPGATPARRPDPQAYVYVTRARALLARIRAGTMTGARSPSLALGDEADRLVRRALAIDPRSSEALLVLATLARNGWTSALAARRLTTQQRVDASLALVRQALLAQPNDAAALTQLGDFDRRYAWHWDDAERLFRRALAIDPGLVDAHWSYGYQLGTLGRGVEGIEHALAVVRLDAGNPYHRIALPRLLHVNGRTAQAMALYRRELALRPADLFVLREVYFTLLSLGDAAGLAALAQRIATTRFADAPADGAALSRRVAAGVAALGGRPEALRALIATDIAAYESPVTLGDATPQGRARDDLPYIFAIESAWANETEQAIAMLDRALAARSLYWPTTLPFGPAPFPAAMRRDPAWGALWVRDPAVRDLVARRRAALFAGQSAGYDEAGRWHQPAFSTDLARRIVAAQRRWMA